MKFKAEDGSEWESTPSGDYVFENGVAVPDARFIKRIPERSELEKYLDENFPDLGPNSKHARSCYERGFHHAIDTLEKHFPYKNPDVAAILKKYAGIK